MKRIYDTTWKKILLWVISCIIGSITLIGLFLFVFFENPKAFIQFINDYRLVRTHYFRTISDGELFQGAVKGLVQQLEDPYSVYLFGDNYKGFIEQTTGEFGGVGIVIGSNLDNKFLILSVFKKGPAHDAGIESGGELIAVDGESVAGLEPEFVTKKIRGKIGTTVTLSILKDGERKEYTMQRSDIVMPTVSSDFVERDIGYIHIYSFAKHTPEEFAEELDKLKKLGVKKLIIDLRMNPGGTIESVVDVANQILTKGSIVSFESKNGKSHTYTIDGVDTPLPLIVLIDKNSASASEILAGAVQDKKEGLIIGQNSFGKGTVQSIISLDEQSALKISIAQYLTAAGRKIDKVGIKPDIEVEPAGILFNIRNDVVIQRAVHIFNTN